MSFILVRMKRTVTMITRIGFLFFFLIQSKISIGQMLISPDNEGLTYVGRIDFSDVKAPKFAWPGVTIEGKFTGSELSFVLDNIPSTSDPSAQNNFYNVFVDDSLVKVIRTVSGKRRYEVSRKFNEGEHTFKLYKLTESTVGVGIFYGLELENGAKLVDHYSPHYDHQIEFIGNSITCGYGVEGNDKTCKFSDSTENNYKSYAAITARNFNAEAQYIAYSGKGVYQNYNQNRDYTMFDLQNVIYPDSPTVGGKIKDWSPELVIINLGTNDFSHVNPDSLIWTHRYLAFIDSIKLRAPNARIICCISQMMSDYWPQGNNARSTIKKFIDGIVSYRKLGGDNNITICELSPQGKYGYGCDWHPSYLQNQLNSKELTEFIAKWMNWTYKSPSSSSR